MAKTKKSFDLKASAKKLKKFWKQPLSPDYHLSLKEVAAFSVSSLGMNFIINVGYLVLTAAIIPIAYGVEAIHATIITVAVSILNLIITPIFGNIIDNPKKKGKGKLKPHFLWMTPLITVLAILASFSPLDIITNKTVRLVYLYCTAVPMLCLQQLFVSLSNLYPAVMTPNSQERANMLSPVSLILSLAPTIMNFLLGPIRDVFKRMNKEYWAFRIYGIVFSLLGFALTFFIFKFTKERVYDTQEDVKKEKVGFLKGISMIAKNKPLLLYVAFGIFTVLKTTFYLQMPLLGEYKYQSDYGVTTYSSLTLITGFGATPGMLIAPLLIKKFGKKNVILFGTGIQTVILAVLAIVGFQNMPVGIASIIICTLYGFLYNLCTGLNIIVFPSLLADLIDYQQYISNERIEGYLNSFNMWVSSLFGVAFQFIPVLIQTNLLGFEQGLDIFRPSPGSIASGVFNPDYVVGIANSWFNAATYIALIACVLSMIPLFFYTFNEKKHKQYMEEIKLRAVSSTFEEEESLEEAKDSAIRELEEMGESAEEIKEIIESSGASVDGGSVTEDSISEDDKI